MKRGAFRTARLARHWYRPDDSVRQEEIVLQSSRGIFETTRYRRREGDGGPTWVLLHGITRPGRRHAVLTRFAQALAGTGATVLVPEIPEWTALELVPEPAGDAVLAALETLAADPGRGASSDTVLGSPDSVGLIGFSFAAPQAIRLATDPEVGPRLACVAGFGGYGTLQRAVAFLWSGRHEWDGRSYSTRPDPYGRWVVGGNFLTLVPGYEDAGDVAGALTDLAALAGDRQIPSWDPVLDELKDRLEARLPRGRRGLFRQFAPPAEADPPGDLEGWGTRLAEAGVAARPLLELPPIVRSTAPVVLIHGRGDALVPFSETLRLAERVRAPSLEVAVTGLFEHSAEARTRGSGWFRELRRLGGTLASLLGSV
jgi:pimeloyl-ACP methyl ester carboxylesterase